jgi:hypothetical protein
MKMLKSYEVHCRMPLTTLARNAGAVGRKHWWALVGYINATSKKHACAKARKQELVPSHADKLKAYTCF